MLTIPRISGRSSFTTTSPTRLRPRVRSVSRWFCLQPIRLFVWVVGVGTLLAGVVQLVRYLLLKRGKREHTLDRVTVEHENRGS